MEWYVSQQGLTTGPVSETDPLQDASEGRLHPDALVRREGMPDWQNANSLPGLLAPPVIPTSVTAMPTTKQLLIGVGLLATLFVGALLVSTRYTPRSYHGTLYVVDRWTGAVRFCTPQGCREVTSVPR